MQKQQSQYNRIQKLNKTIYYHCHERLEMLKPNIKKLNNVISILFKKKF